MSNADRTGDQIDIIEPLDISDPNTQVSGGGTSTSTTRVWHVSSSTDSDGLVTTEVDHALLDSRVVHVQHSSDLPTRISLASGVEHEPNAPTIRSAARLGAEEPMRASGQRHGQPHTYELYRGVSVPITRHMSTMDNELDSRLRSGGWHSHVPGHAWGQNRADSPWWTDDDATEDRSEPQITIMEPPLPPGMFIPSVLGYSMPSPGYTNLRRNALHPSHMEPRPSHSQASNMIHSVYSSRSPEVTPFIPPSIPPSIPSPLPGPLPGIWLGDEQRIASQILTRTPESYGELSLSRGGSRRSQMESPLTPQAPSAATIWHDWDENEERIYLQAPSAASPYSGVTASTAMAGPASNVTSSILHTNSDSYNPGLRSGQTKPGILRSSGERSRQRDDSSAASHRVRWDDSDSDSESERIQAHIINIHNSPGGTSMPMTTRYGELDSESESERIVAQTVQVDAPERRQSTGGTGMPSHTGETRPSLNPVADDDYRVNNVPNSSSPMTPRAPRPTPVDGRRDSSISSQSSGSNESPLPETSTNHRSHAQRDVRSWQLQTYSYVIPVTFKRISAQQTKRGSLTRFNVGDILHDLLAASFVPLTDHLTDPEQIRDQAAEFLSSFSDNHAIWKVDVENLPFRQGQLIMGMSPNARDEAVGRRFLRFRFPLVRFEWQIETPNSTTWRANWSGSETAEIKVMWKAWSRSHASSGLVAYGFCVDILTLVEGRYPVIKKRVFQVANLIQPELMTPVPYPGKVPPLSAQNDFIIFSTSQTMIQILQSSKERMAFLVALSALVTSSKPIVDKFSPTASWVLTAVGIAAAATSILSVFAGWMLQWIDANAAKHRQLREGSAQP